MNTSESKINSLLEEFIGDLTKQEAISAVGLYGSWGRYEASPQSDVDLLVVDKRSFDYRSSELLEHKGFFIDISRIPRRWIEVNVNPEVDHMIYESLILHDPEGVLKRAKRWIAENYRTPGRVDIRTEHNLILSDSYLSRATSAMLRRDWETAAVYAAVSMEPGVEVLMDVASIPVTEIAFVWNLRRACERLELPGLYKSYLSAARLLGEEVSVEVKSLIRRIFREILGRPISETKIRPLDADDISSDIKAFEESWGHISSFMKENRRVLERTHRRLRGDIFYRTMSPYPRIVLTRTKRMMEEKNYIEAAHYLRVCYLKLLEEFSEISSRIQGRKFDYPSLFRSLRGTKGAEEIYRNAVEIFSLKDLGEEGAKKSIESARDVISFIRRSRKDLIAKYL